MPIFKYIRGMIKLLLPALILGLISCRTGRSLSYQVKPDGEVKAETTTMPFLEQLLREDSLLSALIDKKDEYKIQVIYTRIDRNAANDPKFTDCFFNVNPAHYFYPASTVKMPAAIMALEKVAALKGQGIDRETTLITGTATPGQSPVYNDPLTPDGRPTLTSYIRKIFLVSDNDAFNRTYEFVGQGYLNEGLRAKGYPETEIVHRLQISLPEEENRRTNPIRFLDRQGKLLWEQPAAYQTAPYFQRRDSLGDGFMQGNALVPHPMDFSHKNRIGLQSLHNIMKTVIFPMAVKPEQRFQMSEEDRLWLVKTMGEFPTESRFPPYPGQDTAGNKILFYGDGKTGPVIPGLRIFNKTGGAYGFLLDIAYFADLTNNVEFMLSAVIYCNQDNILNDDKYDYETIGYPFMRSLGRKIYDHERSRQREHTPDLSAFRFKW
jgi:hypothetical protein